MIPIETLIELVGLATESWCSPPQFRGVQPTDQSLERIQRELGIPIPADYIRIAAACPTYVGWLASIGEDYDHPYHILRINADFRTPEEPPVLPAHFVLLNHGHDGDCDCWDLRGALIGGEFPIVYVDMEADPPRVGGLRFESFRAYMEDFVRYHAPRTANGSRRQRAKELLKAYPLAVQDQSLPSRLIE